MPAIIKELKCACKGDTLDKLLQPIILLILRDHIETGYGIRKHLSGFSMFHRDLPDMTGLYRQLKNLEEQGKIKIVDSEELPTGMKKTYTITPLGRTCLMNWKKTLSEYESAVRDIREQI